MSDTSAPPFTVREEIVPADRSKIFALLSGNGFFQPREMAYGMDLFDEHLLKGERSHHQFMLYETGGQLLAYGCYSPIRLTDRRYHLQWLAVDRGHQSHGLGYQLEKAIAQKIKLEGGSHLFAEVSNRAHHKYSRDFYEKCGYSTAATVPDYYATGDDMVVYVKDLHAR